MGSEYPLLFVTHLLLCRDDGILIVILLSCLHSLHWTDITIPTFTSFLENIFIYFFVYFSKILLFLKSTYSQKLSYILQCKYCY